MIFVPTIFWAIIFVLALYIEAETAELVAIWFVPGAAVCTVLSAYYNVFWVQALIFVISSAALLLFANATVRKKLLKNIGKEKTDTDILIGKTAKVEEEINNSEEKGTVKIDGRVWSARLVDENERASPGEFVVIESISGVKLMCRKKKEE